MSSLIIVLFFAVPAVSAIVLIVSLSLYWAAKIANKETSGTYTEKQVNRYKLIATLSGIVTGAFVLIFLGMIGLLYLAVAFM